MKYKGEMFLSLGVKVLNEVFSDGVILQENLLGLVQLVVVGFQRKWKGNVVVEGKGKEFLNGGEINLDSKMLVELVGIE